MPITIERIESLVRAGQDYQEALARLLDTLRAYSDLEPSNQVLRTLSGFRAEGFLAQPIRSAEVLASESTKLRKSRSENARRKRKREERRNKEFLA